jgi:hypothetical protein
MKPAILGVVLFASPAWADVKDLDAPLKRLAGTNDKLLTVLKVVKDRQSAESARDNLERVAADRAKIQKEIAAVEVAPADREAAAEVRKKLVGPSDSAVLKEIARISLVPEALAVLEEQSAVKEAAMNLEKIARVKVRVANMALKTLMIKNNGQSPMALSEVGRYLEDPKTALTDPWGRELNFDPTGKKNGGKQPDLWIESPFGGKKVIGNWQKN